MKNTNKGLVVGNWKLNPLTEKEAKEIFSKTKNFAKKQKKTQVVICPPYPYISVFAKQKSFKRFSLGSQDVFDLEQGSFTGFVSTALLAQYKISHSIVGHSERRARGETSLLVSKKVASLLKRNITPIVCIGESERDHSGAYLSFLKKELFESLSGISRKDLNNIVIAYEPIWAIGKRSKDSMPPIQVHETVLLIRKFLTEKFGAEFAKKPQILYGGSVEASNAEDLMENGHVSGFLVGHASLKPEQFNKIIEAVEESKAIYA